MIKPNPVEMSVDEIQEELYVLSNFSDQTNETYHRIGALESELEERSDVYWMKKEIARD